MAPASAVKEILSRECRGIVLVACPRCDAPAKLSFVEQDGIGHWRPICGCSAELTADVGAILDITHLV